MSNFYNQASWVLVPSGIEEDIVFAQKPISGLGDLTFTRASDATYTDASGVVRRSPYNLLTWSEDFSNAVWIKQEVTISSNVAIAPNGTQSADKITPSTLNTVHQIRMDSVVSASQCSFGVFAKADGYSTIEILDRISATDGAIFNLNNGTFTNKGSGIGKIENYGNGWYRCTVTANTTGIRIYVPSSSSSAGDGTSGVLLWGAQLVEGTSALDYFPTTNRQDVPRIDFRNADGTLSSCGRLLLEPQRTNLVPNGLAYQPATGVLYNSAVSGSPMAGVNCARITKNEAAGTIRYAQQQCSSSVLAGSTGYVLSAFFKHDGVDFATSMEFNNSGNFGGVSWSQVINIASTGVTLGTSTSCTSTVENWGSGWYRVNVRITTGAAPSGSFVTYLMRLPSTLSTGQGFLHALPQFELGAYQTTYIPTTTAAVTRLADTASKTGVSSLIGQTEGTLFAEINYRALSEGRRILGISDGTTSNRIVIATEASNIFRFITSTAGVLQIINSSTVTSGNYKLAIGYKNNDFVFYVNGVQIGALTSVSVPACSDIYLGKLETSTVSTILSDQVVQAALFPTRLPNATLAQLTTL